MSRARALGSNRDTPNSPLASSRTRVTGWHGFGRDHAASRRRMSHPLTSMNAIGRAADAKLLGSGFSGNAYTAHGRLREPEIARMGRRDARHPAVVGLFPRRGRETAPRDPRRHRPRHLRSGAARRDQAPDEAWRSIPRTYLRQGGGSSACSALSARWSPGSGTAASWPSATRRAAPGSIATRARSASLVRLATALIDELYRHDTQPDQPNAAERMQQPPTAAPAVPRARPRRLSHVSAALTATESRHIVDHGQPDS